MGKYSTLAELQAAYQSGELTGAVLMIDNDDTSVYAETGKPDPDDYECVFSMHPVDVMEQALTILGIPFDHV